MKDILRFKIKHLFALIWLSISCYSFRSYVNYNSITKESLPIAYEYIERKVVSGAKGETYQLIYKVNNIIGEVAITSIDYDSITAGKYPDLFYSKKDNVYFSRWDLKRSARISAVFFIFFVIAIFPWNFIENLLNLRTKPKVKSNKTNL